MSDLPPYAAPQPYLQQGDIFRQDIVIPVADSIKRLFRAADGRHGSVVFADQVPAKVFDEAELRQLLARTTRENLHTEPFTNTHDDQPEWVVAQARLTSYFILVTQTCDVSGVDKPCVATATIMPIVSIMEFCRRDKLPFVSAQNSLMTIEDFLSENAGASALKEETNAVLYPAKLRESLAQWNPTGKKLVDRSKINNFLVKGVKSNFTYYLQGDADFGIPESFVDFSSIFTVPTVRVREQSSARVACLNGSYRDHFAQEFGNRFARIAVPKPMAPSGF